MSEHGYDPAGQKGWVPLLLATLARSLALLIGHPLSILSTAPPGNHA